MNKKGVLIILILGAISYYLLSNDISSYYLEKTFQKSGANFLNMKIEGHSFINTDKNPYFIMQKMMKSYQKFQILQEEKSNDECTVVFKSQEEQYTLNIKKLSNSKVVFASLSLSQDKAIENINNIRKAISASFNSCGVKASFSTLIEGKYNRKLSQSDMNNIAFHCLEGYGGRFVDGYSEGSIISICGYVPNIKEKIECSNKYINVNIAMRYSENDGCTYLWLANPIIAEEY